MSTNLRAMLIRHEAKRPLPYLDCCGQYWRDCHCAVKGNLTIGVGRNLDDRGLSVEEILFLLANDMAGCEAEARRVFRWFAAIDDVRRDAVLDMLFNLGMTKLLRFKKFLAAMEAQHYVQAAAEMRDSKWAEQVGDRALELADMIRSGRYRM